MRFLVDADLPRRSAALLRSLGHLADDVRDIGLGRASDADIAAHARRNGACLVTGDFGFADIRNYPPEKYPGLIVLVPPPEATAGTILDLLQQVVDKPRLLKQFPGRLAIVEPGRVRFRPA
ncbi:MAG: DUF5615 family PIN-like protein [Planctomycetes bacterium]|nr:DUF5615 family PIN-like protein [Planctomycetota bacterium]